MKIISIIKGVFFIFIGILLLIFSIYYTIFVFYFGIDSLSIISFFGGICFIVIGINNLKIKNATDKITKSTICWKCKCQYSFTKNQSGPTYVICPKCNSKGVIK